MLLKLRPRLKLSVQLLFSIKRCVVWSLAFVGGVEPSIDWHFGTRQGKKIGSH